MRAIVKFLDRVPLAEVNMVQRSVTSGEIRQEIAFGSWELFESSQDVEEDITGLGHNNGKV